VPQKTGSVRRAEESPCNESWPLLRPVSGGLTGNRALGVGELLEMMPLPFGRRDTVDSGGLTGNRALGVDELLEMMQFPFGRRDRGTPGIIVQAGGKTVAVRRRVQF